MSFKAWFYLNEAVQQIVNLGYPKLIADIFEKKFGRKANAIAKWYKDAHSRGYDEGWWDMHANPFGGYLNMKDLMRMYEALPDPEKYKEVMKKLGYEPSPEPRDSDYYNNQKENVYEQIKQKLLGDSFFDDHFIKAIIDGSQQIPPYKGMSLTNAREKYEKKLLFKDATPIRKYSDGMRWIDAGKTCVYLGQRMKNCGRVGAMSIDSDATIFALFDENENPHAMVTYEPHQNRITGIEGPGRTELKSEYDHYVLDLLQSLNADYAYEKQGANTRLALKWLLGPEARTIEELVRTDNSKYHKFFHNGKYYYSNGNQVITDEDIDKIIKAVEQGRYRHLQPLVSNRNSIATAILGTPGLFHELEFKSLYRLFNKR